MLRKIKNLYHLFVAIFWNLFYRFPGKSLLVIGVTGTDGKTTTVSLIYHILKESGRKASLIGSVEAKIGEKSFETEFHRTTPSSSSLQKFLRKAVDEGSKYFVLEVTSHAIDQHRIWGIPFEVGVLTNVTKEHLDYHKTYDKYLDTKSKLLKSAKIAILNRDDGSYNLLKDSISKKSAKNLLTYGFSKSSSINPKKISLDGISSISDYNKHNFLAAGACALMLGVEKLEIEKAFLSFILPRGRMDEIYKNTLSIIIDFAHTPNSFQEVLSFLRPKTSGRIIHVFGSAGERDYYKRPVMGQISSKFSDIIILTSEDPRSESPSEITRQIAQGIKKPSVKVYKIEDRQKAINKAVETAEKGDLIVITGKGHEKSMNLGEGEIHWDEYEAVKKALKLKNGK